MKKRFLINFILTMCAALLLAACGSQTKQTEAQATKEPENSTAEPIIANVVINEVMPKNEATLRDNEGQFTDWVEIRNASGKAVDLSGWIIDSGKETKAIDSLILDDSEYGLIFIDVAKSGMVQLFDANGNETDRLEIISNNEDISLIRDENGSVSECKYPTPGLENTAENYDNIQSTRVTESPVVINEVCVENFSYRPSYDYDYMDYVELKNVTGNEVDVSGWRITDKLNNSKQYEITNKTLKPYETMLIYCDSDFAKNSDQMSLRVAPFSLDSGYDDIFLLKPDGELADYTSLNDIPYGMTYGRIDGENGFFYIEHPTPDDDNEGNAQRRVAASPKAVSEDGIFENTDSVEVKLSSDNDIYYTTDGTVPTAESQKYTGPFTVSETCTVRAISVAVGCINSRAITLNYFINEGHTLPIVSVVSDDKKQFDDVYMWAQSSKTIEMPGVISYYGDDGSFTLGAGIKMHGFSTLVLPKKSMSFKFRDCYGQNKLSFDLFHDGGTTDFKDLVLRAGGDQSQTIVKNEVCLNLAYNFSDNMPITRNKYVAVYADGEYLGVYALMEKTNEAWFANTYGVKKDSVTVVEEPTFEGNPFREEVLKQILYGDMSDPEKNAKVCDVLDIDSLIDWTLLEGFTGNWDLASGNLRYGKTTEGDGKWKFILYDLDQAFLSANNCFAYVLGSNTVGSVNRALLKNGEFKQRFLERASYVLKNELTVEKVWAEYERLAAEIDEEVKIEEQRNINSISYESWQKHLKDTKKILFEDFDWYTSSAKVISHYCGLSLEEEKYWFGEL